MKIGIIGLGYVGLPLAAAFSAKYEVVGFDINKARIGELVSGFDRTLELDKTQMQTALQNGIKFSLNLDDIKDCNFYIVTVPTPIDKNNRPDLTPVIKASQSVAKVLKKGDIVVYESTVYPGVTEEICVPILEQSGLKFNIDFFCGYSPERINPGDKEHTVTKIRKITSGSTPKIADKVDEIYSSVITAGTYKASSIKVAEAAKVIENTQRDINIAFMNELAMIFERLGIDTSEVLAAAATKWNFLNFRPGLVGGHCIGVDPYYLTHKAQELGYHPEIILAGRRINDNMGKYVASQVIKLMIKRGILINKARVLVLGVTFKENCPDIRNSRVIDVINELKDFGCVVDVSDPWADTKEVKHEYGFDLVQNYVLKDYDCVVLAVAHNEFKSIDLEDSLVYDIKNIYPKADAKL
ncbi:nucleotide sugar dehydrogenase [Campylobacter mucosalis]|uniref:Polysaccharide biosynthesis protein, nucleotide sugar dehydrogenase, TviB family n=1 Tax=Campylobacter mucosalis CCUG 21559 TaxID=1032067 RepID=A0A6G5QFQ8_9BACT|nr:nucleotide sugar dehydrogenase [Campylobacter mucosalis]QCD44510.1 polysaccharide biosynthesis protein, nucleotide sugar dehydrogenase, TviB family [Campylobacter mucosalis CCUG 21559]